MASRCNKRKKETASDGAKPRYLLGGYIHDGDVHDGYMHTTVVLNVPDVRLTVRVAFRVRASARWAHTTCARHSGSESGWPSLIDHPQFFEPSGGPSLLLVNRMAP